MLRSQRRKNLVRKRQLRGIMIGFFLLSHPGPVTLHVLAVVILAFLAAWPHIAWATLGLVVAAHAAMQLSIAVLNDYCDRHLDVASKKSKPIPRGLVTAREALIVGILLSICMVFLLLFLPPLALAASLLYWLLGLAYNLGLKSSPFSGIVFALAMPLIPVYAFASMGHVAPLVFWLVPVVALLGIALNLANSLPDIEADAALRANTLAVRLGVRRTFLLCPLLIALSALLIASLTFGDIVPGRFWPIIATLGSTCVLLITLIVAFGPGKPVAMRKSYFYIVVLTCFVLAGGWLLGATI
jgi:4-hydroxybenzoate polyprenyltransferase